MQHFHFPCGQVFFCLLSFAVYQGQKFTFPLTSNIYPLELISRGIFTICHHGFYNYIIKCSFKCIYNYLINVVFLCKILTFTVINQHQWSNQWLQFIASSPTSTISQNPPLMKLTALHNESLFTLYLHLFVYEEKICESAELNLSACLINSSVLSGFLLQRWLIYRPLIVHCIHKLNREVWLGVMLKKKKT